MISQEITAKTVRIESQTTPLQSLLSVEPHPSRERAFALCAKGLAPLVSHVYYEKDDSDLRLSFVLRKGLDLTIIVGDMPSPHNRVERLYTRAMRALSREKDCGVFRFALSLNDFEETGTTPKDLARLCLLLNHRLGREASLLIFFETRRGFRAVLQSSRENLHAALARKTRTERKKAWSLSIARWDSLDLATADTASIM